MSIADATIEAAPVARERAPRRSFKERMNDAHAKVEAFFDSFALTKNGYEAKQMLRDERQTYHAAIREHGRNSAAHKLATENYKVALYAHANAIREEKGGAAALDFVKGEKKRAGFTNVHEAALKLGVPASMLVTGGIRAGASLAAGIGTSILTGFGINATIGRKTEKKFAEADAASREKGESFEQFAVNNAEIIRDRRNMQWFKTALRWGAGVGTAVGTSIAWNHESLGQHAGDLANKAAHALSEKYGDAIANGTGHYWWFVNQMSNFFHAAPGKAAELIHKITENAGVQKTAALGGIVLAGTERAISELTPISFGGELQAGQRGGGHNWSNRGSWGNQGNGNRGNSWSNRANSWGNQGNGNRGNTWTNRNNGNSWNQDNGNRRGNRGWGGQSNQDGNWWGRGNRGNNGNTWNQDNGNMGNHRGNRNVFSNGDGVVGGQNGDGVIGGQHGSGQWGCQGCQTHGGHHRGHHNFGDRVRHNDYFNYNSRSSYSSNGNGNSINLNFDDHSDHSINNSFNSRNDINVGEQRGYHHDVPPPPTPTTPEKPVASGQMWEVIIRENCRNILLASHSPSSGAPTSMTHWLRLDAGPWAQSTDELFKPANIEAAADQFINTGDLPIEARSAFIDAMNHQAQIYHDDVAHKVNYFDGDPLKKGDQFEAVLWRHSAQLHNGFAGQPAMLGSGADKGTILDVSGDTSKTRHFTFTVGESNDSHGNSTPGNDGEETPGDDADTSRPQ
jgi:hypothetical protein